MINNAAKDGHANLLFKQYNLYRQLKKSEEVSRILSFKVLFSDRQQDLV